jgi:hypothetical protein
MTVWLLTWALAVTTLQEAPPGVLAQRGPPQMLQLLQLHCCGWQLGMPLLHAGLPADSDRTYCTSNVSASCYFYDPYGKTYSQAKAKCSSGLPWHGWLASYNSSEEQRDVERVGAGDVQHMMPVIHPEQDSAQATRHVHQPSQVCPAPLFWQ